MKCPKCNYSSFEYLGSCKKCGNDLTLHKTELGIDFPPHASLGIAAFLREESGGVSSATATAVAEEQVRDSSTGIDADLMSGTSGIEASLASDTNFGDLGAGIDLEGGDEVDLSGIGESSDETASITLPPIEEDEISLGEDKGTAGTGKDGFDLGDFELDLGETEEAMAPAASGAVVEQELDLGDMDIGVGEEKAAPVAPAEGVHDDFGLDLGDLDLGDMEQGGAGDKEPEEMSGTDAIEALGTTGKMISPDETGSSIELDIGDASVVEEPKKQVSEKDAQEEFSLDGMDIDLSDLDLSGEGDAPEGGKEKKPEGKKDKKEDDFEIDLSDLKLE